MKKMLMQGLIPSNQTPYTDNFRTEEKLITDLLKSNQQPMSATDEVNMATLNGARQNKEEYLDQFGRELANQQIAYKQGWEESERLKNAYRAVGNVEGAAQQAALQEQYHKAAEDNRELARRQGINLSGYGTGVPLQEAIMNLRNNDMGAMRNFLNEDMDSEQYYAREYANLRNEGLSDRRASQEAGRRAQLYKSERLAKYATAMQMYGTDGNGALTNFAIQMMDRIKGDSPETAELYYKMYASPKEQYQNAIQAEMAAAAREDNHQSAMQQLYWNNQFQNDRQDRAFNYNVFYKYLENLYDQQQAEQKAYEERNNAIIKNKEEYNKTPQGKYQNTFQAIYAATGDENLAHNGAMAEVFPQATKMFNEKIKTAEELEKSQEEIKNTYKAQHAAIEYFLGLGTDEGKQQALDAIAALQDSVAGEGAKNSKWLDEKIVKYELGKVDLYKQVAEGKLTLKEMKNKMFRETFGLENIHSKLKTGQNKAAMAEIEESLKVLREGNISHNNYYDFNEAKTIELELEKLLSVAKGEKTYKEMFEKKEEVQKTNAEQWKNYDMSMNIPYMGQSANPYAGNTGYFWNVR